MKDTTSLVEKTNANWEEVFAIYVIDLGWIAQSQSGHGKNQLFVLLLFMGVHFCSRNNISNLAGQSNLVTSTQFFPRKLSLFGVSLSLGVLVPPPWVERDVRAGWWSSSTWLAMCPVWPWALWKKGLSLIQFWIASAWDLPITQRIFIDLHWFESF